MFETQFGGAINDARAGRPDRGRRRGRSSAFGTAGLITQGSGDIDIYSLGSVLLGLSRILTTFGGNILAWSATGDINAGRGAKTTVVYTPPRRVYDNYGSVTLAPTVPSSGAGIATLNPIPDVPPGDIDLIAPLGTIDAGEAGIRVSGNINLAALHIVNAANIKVQGTSAGIPVAMAPNIAGLTAASNVAGAASNAAGDAANRSRQGRLGQDMPSIITVEVIGYGGGDGAPLQDKPQGQDGKRPGVDGRQSYNPNSAVQYVGAGVLNDEQKRQLAQAQ
ncbi:MAG: filamentous hemagglutinin family protein [Parvibaculaceae bacterium]|nr:filamentous hemagglutinin family protein [Parvibaculaceae bacterium]